MILKGNFTQIPDEWIKLCGKYPSINKETGEINKDNKGKDKYINVSHTYIMLLAKIESFNFAKPSESTSGYRIGKCTASNAYFADWLKVSKGTVNNMLCDLYELGWVSCFNKKEGKQIVQRFLYVNHEALDNILSKEDEHQMMSDSPNDVHLYTEW